MNDDHKVVDGSFLVRDRARFPGEYVLAVVYKGKPTHHLINKQEGDDSFTVNKRSYGHASTLVEVSFLCVLWSKGSVLYIIIIIIIIIISELSQAPPGLLNFLFFLLHVTFFSFP